MPSDQLANQGPERPRVGLFVTCLVDFFRPQVGFAAVKLLEDAGCEVSVPLNQTCCGQPAYNSGDSKSAAAVAEGVVRAFAEFDYVVAPSGSCAGMIHEHYPRLFQEDPVLGPMAADVAGKTHELISFMVDILGVDRVEAAYEGVVTYHDSCSGLRELKIKAQPRRLLASVAGAHLRELPSAETCCGFGGAFCVKYPDISNKMVTEKTDDITATGADTLLAGDLGCLLNMAGKLSREGSGIQVRHVAEVLAGMGDAPAIGQADEPVREEG